MSIQIAAQCGAYLNSRDLRFPRNQEEAGISHLQWEGRLKPLRPMSHDVAMGIGVFSTIAVACLFL